MLHSLRRSCIDGVEKGFVFSLALFNALTCAGVGFEDFECCDSAATIGLGKESLANDVSERLGKTLPHRLLLGRREGTDDALHGLGRVHRVQAGEYKVA